MKFLPIVTSIIVAVALYFIVIKREQLLEFAGISMAAPATDAGATDAPAATADAGLIKVVVRHSEAQMLNDGVVLRGRTEPARQVEVRSETSGRVISEPLRKGAFVNEGDLLCELDPGTRQVALTETNARLQEAMSRLPVAEAGVPEAEARQAEAAARKADAEARLTEAQSRLAEAEINENVAKSLQAQGFASETRVANASSALESARAGITTATASVEGALAGIVSANAALSGARATVDGAKAAIISAQAAVAGAERQLEQLKINAPFSGLLETDAAELGSLLQPGSPCATIIQLDPVKLVAFVAEGDVAKIEVGALAGGRLASGEEVRGRVTFLSRSSEDATRTFRVEITVRNADLAIRGGETADILVAAEGRKAHLLPQSALTLDDNGELGVRTLGEGNVVEFTPVTLIRDAIEGVYLGGLPDSVDVIVVGQEYVVSGVTVAPTFEEASQ